MLTLKENKKYLAIKKLVETGGNKKRVATELCLTIRQIGRLIAGYKEFGKKFFVHGNRGRKPATALTLEMKDIIEYLYNTKYFYCTYTLFTEFLAERENIFLSTAEVGNILRERFILSPKSHKVTRKEIAKFQEHIVAVEDAHPRQPRSIYFGEEVQIDASDHFWFGNLKSQLHAAIDDSTGQVLAAYFGIQETLNGYYNIFYQILTKYQYTLPFQS